MARKNTDSSNNRTTITQSAMMQKKLSDIHAAIFVKAHHGITHSKLIECIIALGTKNYSAVEVADTILAYQGDAKKAWKSESN